MAPALDLTCAGPGAAVKFRYQAWEQLDDVQCGDAGTRRAGRALLSATGRSADRARASSAAALILAPAAGLTVPGCRYPLWVAFIRNKDLHRMKEVGERVGIRSYLSRAANNGPSPIPGGDGNCCQRPFRGGIDFRVPVMPVLHQMKPRTGWSKI